MDVTALATVAIAAKTGIAKQDLNVQLVKQAMDTHTQAAETLVAQAGEQIAAAANATKIDITV